MVRVRFAPSPTGALHVGGARTALFNWLFARKNKGVFILRIDDTDIARSKKENIASIIKALKWLNIDWDEGPYLQSERIPIYKEVCKKLLDAKKAYKCFCPQEELERLRKEGKVYDGRCKRLKEKEIRKKEKLLPYTIRFEVEKKKIEFEDVIRGKIEFDASSFGDFIILKSDGTPTYNFATVVDDIQMKITHVIRGDDHLSNTPRQLLLYEGLNEKPPIFAHLPMIWGEDRKRLSKRHGAVSVLSYRREGYLSCALVNYLSLLGFSTKESQQIFEEGELIEKFSLDRVSKNPAIFDKEKLLWMNAFYIKKMDEKELLPLSMPFFRRRYKGVKKEKLLKIIPILKERVKLLKDFAKQAQFFFQDPKINEESAVFVIKDAQRTKRILERLLPLLESIHEFSPHLLEEKLRSHAEKEGIEARELFQTIRLFITGSHKSPPLFETMEVLGRECVLRRLKEGMNYIEKTSIFDKKD